MLSAGTLVAIEQHWSRRLGCPFRELRRGDVRIMAHASDDFRDYRGVYACRRADTCIISVPHDLVESVRASLAESTPDEAFEPSALSAALGEAAGIVVGPAALAYTDAAPTDVPSAVARLLTPHDDAALRALAAACEPIEWEHASIDFSLTPIFGCFGGDELLAASSYRILSPAVANMHIITHPSHRGRGLGRAAAAGATAHAIDSGYIAQWQTLESNLPSMAIARALGFEPYCRTIAVRLREGT